MLHSDHEFLILPLYFLPLICESANSTCLHVYVCVVTQWGVHRAADGQDVLVNQFDGTWSVGDLVVEVVGQSRSLQLQLLGLQGRLCRRLCVGHSKTELHTRKNIIQVIDFRDSTKISPGL